MSHIINPIDFENAKGDFGIANTIFVHLSQKLPISPLQRGNIGVSIADSIIAMKSLLKGLNKLILYKESIDKDLENNWALPNTYEKLKEI